MQYQQPPVVFAPVPAYLPSGNDPEALPQVKGWNWGGFFLSWIWAISHERVGTGVVIFLASILPGIGLIVRWGYKIYFGIKGNELAWSSRRFENIKQFQETERAWAIFGGIVFGLNIVTLVIYFLFATLGMFGALG